MKLLQILVVFLYGMAVVPLSHTLDNAAFAIASSVVLGITVFWLIRMLSKKVKMNQMEFLITIVFGAVASGYSVNSPLDPNTTYTFLQTATFVLFGIAVAVGILLNKIKSMDRVNEPFEIVVVWIATFISIMKVQGIVGLLVLLSSGLIALYLIYRVEKKAMPPEAITFFTVLNYLIYVLPVSLSYDGSKWVNISFFVVGTAVLISVLYYCKGKNKRLAAMPA